MKYIKLNDITSNKEKIIFINSIESIKPEYGGSSIVRTVSGDMSTVSESPSEILVLIRESETE